MPRIDWPEEVQLIERALILGEEDRESQRARHVTHHALVGRVLRDLAYSTRQAVHPDTQASMWREYNAGYDGRVV